MILKINDTYGKVSIMRVSNFEYCEDIYNNAFDSERPLVAGVKFTSESDGEEYGIPDVNYIDFIELITELYTEEKLDLTSFKNTILIGAGLSFYEDMSRF